MNKYQKLNAIIHYVVKAVSLVTLLLLALICFFILKESLGFVFSGNIKSIFSFSWRPLSKNPSFGLLSMITGTLYIGLLASLFALPMAIGCALFISRYITGRLKYVTMSMLDMLAGIPSVVYGFLGLVTIVKLLEKSKLLTTGESILAAVITLTIMVIPFMISSYVKAFDYISNKYLLQTTALGTSPWYNLTHLVLQATKGHILTGYMLALSRALGETMAVMMVVGNSTIAPKLLGKGITLSGLIALEMSGSQLGSLHYQSLYTAGAILMLFLVIINYLIRKIDRKVNKYES